MSETVKTRFLIRGTKEKSEDNVFQGHHLHQIPRDRAADRLSLLHTAGTIREQICYHSMVILAHSC